MGEISAKGRGMLDLSDAAVRQRRQYAESAGPDGEHGEGICGICGSSVYISGECACSLAAAKVRPDYDPGTVTLEEDPLDRLHDVFYRGHHFQLQADRLYGEYRLGCTASTNPDADIDVISLACDKRYATLTEAMSAIQIIVDKAVTVAASQADVSDESLVGVDL